MAAAKTATSSTITNVIDGGCPAVEDVGFMFHELLYQALYSVYEQSLICLFYQCYDQERRKT